MSGPISNNLKLAQNLLLASVWSSCKYIRHEIMAIYHKWYDLGDKFKVHGFWIFF